MRAPMVLGYSAGSSLAMLLGDKRGNVREQVNHSADDDCCANNHELGTGGDILEVAHLRARYQHRLASSIEPGFFE
jgi:hypothetical protein